MSASTSSDNRPAGRTTRDRALRWLPPVVWMAVIFAASATPSALIPNTGPWDALVKNGGHLLSYALLAWLWLRALQPTLSPPRLFWVAFAIAILYAVSDEYHQTFVPGRDGNPGDVLIDATGALLAILLWGRQARRRP